MQAGGQNIDISDFNGISRQVLSDKLPVQYFDTLKNIYEPKLGELRRRGGGSLNPISWPSNVSSIDNAFFIKSRGATKRKVVAVNCTPVTIGADTTALEAGCAVSMVNVTGGQWNSSVTGNFYRGLIAADAGQITLQFVGYGLNWATVYSAGNDGSKNGLRVAIASPLDSRCVGINVYVNVTVATSLSLIDQQVWVGYIDLLATPTGNFDFGQAPLTCSAYPGATTTYGSADPTFTLEETTGGSLTPGKTYYVEVLANYWHNSGTSVAASLYRKRVTTVQSITLQTGTAINVKNIVGDAVCYLIAVGEHPQLMQPQFITNVVGTNTINSICETSPNCCDLTPYDATQSDYVFWSADTSVTDMLIRYTDAGAKYPVFCTRLADVNKAKFTGANYQKTGSVTSLYQQREFPFGNQSRYQFTQQGELAYFVNDYGNSLSFSLGGFPVAERTQSGYFQTNGLIAATCIVDYGTSFPPKAKYITTFQESIVIAGGTRGSLSYNRAYISNTSNPYNFSQTGTGTTLAYVGVEQGGLPITALGIYSINTSDEGPKTQLVLGKLNSCFKLNTIPTSFDGAFMEVLSAKIGVVSSRVIAQTPIGTIITSLDNVYLLRDTGEPTPIGDDISKILRPEDPAYGTDTSYWNAVYHDNHYKLAYSVNGSARPTQELWLNIEKMKANKGLPAWYGPHEGRTIDYSLVDEVMTEGDQSVRTFITLSGKKIILADVISYTQDASSTDIACQIDFGHNALKRIYTNKKITRMKFLARVSAETNATVECYSDGVLVLTKMFKLKPKSTVTTLSSFLALVPLAFEFFPGDLFRGRAMKFSWKYTGTNYFGISGIEFRTRDERRGA